MMRLRYEQIPLTSNSLDILVAGAKLQELLADTPNDDLKGFNPLVDGGFPDLIVYLFIGKKPLRDALRENTARRIQRWKSQPISPLNIRCGFRG